MENKLITIEKMPINDIMSVSKVFAESGMFVDCKSQAQAMVKIYAGQEIGIPPFAAMSGIHIIQGRPTIGAGLIASRVKGSGKYDYKVTEQSEKNCSIDFYQGGDKIGTSSFSIEDAKKAGTKNIDKFPKNMLFARAISNGVKWYCPDVFSGPVYVPEEMTSVTEDVHHSEITSHTRTDVTETAVVMIADYNDACNAIIDAKTKEEVNIAWKSITPETRKHPAVMDALNAKKVELSKK